MQYKVQTAVEFLEEGTFELRSGWVEAKNHLHAAAVFMLEQPVGNKYLDPITVVEKDTYRLGNYKHKAVNVVCDWEVGLRQ